MKETVALGFKHLLLTNASVNIKYIQVYTYFLLKCYISFTTKWTTKVTKETTERHRKDPARLVCTNAHHAFVTMN